MESKPVESKPVESKPVESKPVESRPVESKPVDEGVAAKSTTRHPRRRKRTPAHTAKASDVGIENTKQDPKTDQHATSDIKSSPAKPKPVESKPVESKPVESKPVESKPAIPTNDTVGSRTAFEPPKSSGNLDS